MSELEYPDHLRYTQDHEWVEQLGSGAEETVRVGITAYAQNALGDVVYVSLPSVGDTVTAGETCGEVESTKSVSDLFAPLSGAVTAVNTALDTAPELVNSAPYTDGWMYELSVATGSLDGLLDAQAYRDSVG
jgi:glycine cleavage system H protein